MVPLALVALVLGDARRRAALPAGMVVVHSLAIAMFFVTGRYRLPIVPFLIVLAAGGILSLVDAFTARRRRVLGFILFAATAALTHANFYRVNREVGFAEFEFRVGLTHERNGDLVKAEESYRAALARETFHAGARLNLGGILSRTGRAEEGLHLIQALSAKRPDDELTQLNLALILADLGRHEEARAAFERVIQVNPKNTQAWHGYGIESYRVGDLDMARRAFATLATRKENAQWVLQSQFLLAKMEHGSSTREGKGNAAAAMRSGDLRAAVEDWQGASNAYRKAADLQPTSQAYYEWGQAAYRLHNAGEAMAALGQCLKLDPRFPGAHMVLAAVHFERKDYDAALEACEREAENSPTNPEVFFRLGFLNENHLKDTRAALRAYRKYIEIGGPRSEPIRQKLASLEARMRQVGDAD
jgi:tetratricopeptide (TPR) repeat protein